ncbi:MAG: MetQ/NlpA family ABC transporter substrate-binding protein [Cetobacterium sp.]
MKNFKSLKAILLFIIFIVIFVGCGKSEVSQNSSGKKIVKLGISGDENIIWENVKAILAKENIELKFINFSDYIRPNLALEERELDINAFQTEIYFDKFKTEHKLSIVNLGYTVLAPMGIYSKKITELSQLKNKAIIAIPNDISNGGRALLLLQDAGIIELNKTAGVFPRVRDIVSNPKNIKIVELVATQIPRSIEDVDAAAINNGVAVEAGYSPLADSIFIEDFKNERLKPYFNIIASREDNQNNPEIKRVLEVYQTPENKKIIDDYYRGSSIAVF